MSDVTTPDGNTLHSRLRGTNLYLIGMMGSGKTTLGQRLAAAIRYQFFDSDAVVEQVAGQSIRDLFAEAGESTFRQLETQVLSELASYKQLVVATGGGIVLSAKNWSYLHHGIVIWLDVPLADLVERLQGTSDRPLLQEEDVPGKLQSLLEQRRSLYAQADIRVTVPGDETPDQTLQRVITALEQAIQAKQDSLPSTAYSNN